MTNESRLRFAETPVRSEVQQSEEDNVGVESAYKLEKSTEAGTRLAEHSYRSQKLRSHRTEEKADVNTRRQKRAIRKQYAASVRSGQRIASATGSAAKVHGKTEFIRRHRTGVGIVAALFLTVALMLGTLFSCTVLLEGGASGMGGTTFPSRDADMLGAEAAYAQMEAALQARLNAYAPTHACSEYIYELDGIGHDPYALVSILTAYRGGFWTLAEVRGILDFFFVRQYTVTETVAAEVRYRGNGEPYEYTICTVKLDNVDFSILAANLLNEEQFNMYSMYMSTRGNRPDLFPISEYPNASR